MGCYCSAEGNETGITHTQPRQQAKHMYRATMKVGPTPKTEAEVGGVLSRLVDDWPGSAYNPTSKNCLHFCNEFCRELELGCIPGWIDHIDHSSSSIKKFPSKGMHYKKQAKGTMTVELEVAMKAVRDQGQPPRTPRSRQDTRSNFSNNLLRLGHDLRTANHHMRLVQRWLKMNWPTLHFMKTMSQRLKWRVRNGRRTMRMGKNPYPVCIQQHQNL